MTFHSKKLPFSTNREISFSRQIPTNHLGGSQWVLPDGYTWFKASWVYSDFRLVVDIDGGGIMIVTMKMSGQDDDNDDL